MEKLWRRIIRRHQRSELPVSAFCQKEGLKVGNFLWWRRELNRRDQETTASLPAPSADGAGEPLVAPVFLPVRVVEADLTPSRPAPPIEIVMHGGPIVRVPSGFDPRTLGEILAVLEGRPC
jgi:hypothetical protein